MAFLLPPRRRSATAISTATLGVAAAALFYARVEYSVDRDRRRERFDNRTISGRRFDALRTTAVRYLGIRQPGPYYFTLYELSPVDSP